MNNTAFDGTDDFFDSREVIERIEELEAIGTETNSEGTEFDADRLCDEFRGEYDALIELRDNAEDYIADWEHGEVFISEFSFTDHMMELLSDVGYLPSDLPGWIVIDREATADNMKADYTEFEFRGTAYYAR